MDIPTATISEHGFVVEAYYTESKKLYVVKTKNVEEGDRIAV